MEAVLLPSIGSVRTFSASISPVHVITSHWTSNRIFWSTNFSYLCNALWENLFSFSLGKKRPCFDMLRQKSGRSVRLAPDKPAFSFTSSFRPFKSYSNGGNPCRWPGSVLPKCKHSALFFSGSFHTQIALPAEQRPSGFAFWSEFSLFLESWS